ncbi:MAG: primosomal protein N' [Candidatus Cryptobacteroides sp.]
MENVLYIKVILPLKLEWEPFYYIPASEPAPFIGQRVRVNLGAKEYVGVISEVGVTPDIVPSQIRKVNSVETGMDEVSVGEIALWRKIAEYYLCTVGEVYKAAYPSGKTASEETVARSNERKELREKQKASKAAEALSRKKEKLEERIAAREAETAKAVRKEKKERLAAEINALREQLAALDAGKSTDECQTTITTTEAVGKTFQLPSLSPLQLPSLSPLQQEVADKILEAFADSKTVLLEGVTGSGKTEIYMTLAARTLEEGRNVLYLVPEIAMSRQLEERLKRVFGEALMVFHSAETTARKRDIAHRLRASGTDAGPDSQTCIVLGTRSSLFLPHRNLGLVIVDEEHDQSYKQDSPAPRYNGRDTAIMLGAIHNGCNVLLGSATPSLESLYNCMTGRYVKVCLNEKYHGNAQVKTEIIDTSAERKKHGMKGSFSFRLINRINSVLEEGGQVLVLRARRAYSPVVQCIGCGYIPRCPRCNVSLSYHKDHGRLICHHCGYSGSFGGLCPKCGAAMQFIGAGTQRIEEELKELFPKARILRMDSDTLTGSMGGKEHIKDFQSGRADIIVGTQMIAKGFDFDNLMLVAALQADALTGIQDFRADEKALQLLEQFKGRCGRRGKEGLFVIQTSIPGHPIYSMLSDNGQSAGHYEQLMLEERKEFRYPPFTRLINISVKDSYQERAERNAKVLSSFLKEKMTMDTVAEITDAFSPPVGKKGNMYEMTIRISLRKDKGLSEAKHLLVKLLNEFEISRDCRGRISIDVDPA